MNEAKAKPIKVKAASAGGASGTPAKPAGPPAAAPVPPLFRTIDWVTFGVTTLLVFIGYYLTLAPNLSLEDSGELAVGSFYAGVPHPPGYPLWTMYTWLFTVILPFSNVAWRVAMSSAVAAALACGVLALMVSRGSSMMLEGIEELKGIERRWENALCMVAGFVAGTLLGFNGFMWSQAVIVEVYTLSVLTLNIVICLLLRWLYAPHQMRYLYWAFFVFGVCFTNHQTLVVAAMGIEVAIAATKPRLGRDLFFFNSIIYILGLVAKKLGFITSFDANLPLFVIYNVVGIGSVAACAWLALKTQGLLSEWKPVLIVWGLAGLGASIYFFMPIASMTNPPMNWGYPRTWGGFVHAFTRGQYERTNPTADPVRFIEQLHMYLQGAVEEFNFVNLLIALIPFLLFRRMQKRERAWMIGLTAIYLCLAVLLLILLNPNTDRQSREQSRVFFTASHVILSMFVAYGLTLAGGYLLTAYAQVRRWALYGSAVGSGIALYALVRLESQFPLAEFTAVFGLALGVVAVLALLLARTRAPMVVLVVLAAILPAHSILSHWSDNEQRGHLFGYWFGHDMFTPPFGLYPEMARNAVLFGGTDPGRFNPTYMIFCESFIPPRCKRETDPDFDRRDVCLITQNALADSTYLEYIRAHYNRSAQKDPYFLQDFFATMQEALRSPTDRMRGTTNGLARALTPLARLCLPLDKAVFDFGARVEARRRAEGVYPPKEILTPSVEDSQQCYQTYMGDATRRMQANQLKPGEDVRVIGDRVQVSGQVAVMAINALLTRVIFDKNPGNEFYVEESFPLDWMYPYLTPFGIILKINREPVPEITEAMVATDHEFWTRYSERLVGNVVTYQTSIQELCDYVERVYLRRDFKGFKGDRKFVRDDVAQKSFSKLRNAIAGVYMWRINAAKTPAERQRMLSEADFAYRQCYAFCPYNLEALYHYVNLLLSANRVDEALALATTTLKFDEENPALLSLVKQLGGMKQGGAGMANPAAQVGQIEAQFRANPSNASMGTALAQAYLQLQRTNAALLVLDQVLASPQLDANSLLNAANLLAQIGDIRRLESALLRVVLLLPENPEGWYDLGAIQVILNKPADALKSLAQALQLSDQRLVGQADAKNLRVEAARDPRFGAVRTQPDFQRLLNPPPR